MLACFNEYLAIKLSNLAALHLHVPRMHRFIHRMHRYVRVFTFKVILLTLQVKTLQNDIVGVFLNHIRVFVFLSNVFQTVEIFRCAEYLLSYSCRAIFTLIMHFNYTDENCTTCMNTYLQHDYTPPILPPTTLMCMCIHESQSNYCQPVLGHKCFHASLSLVNDVCHHW